MGYLRGIFGCIKNTKTKFANKAAAKPLPTPIVTVKDETLEIYDESGLAEEFSILVDGEEKVRVRAHQIEFSFGGDLAATHIAIEGMTFGEWLASEYNTVPYELIVSTNEGFDFLRGGLVYRTLDGVSLNSVIEDGRTYRVHRVD